MIGERHRELQCVINTNFCSWLVGSWTHYTLYHVHDTLYHVLSVRLNSS